MPATVTLSTTTLTRRCEVLDTSISVASTTGLNPGVRLYAEGELMSVLSLGVSLQVNVIRGVDGTASAPHDSGTVLRIGQADQFYTQDPTGRPPQAIPVSPYINARQNKVWFAQGDAYPDGLNRWWQLQTTTYSTSAMGIRVETLSPTSST